MGMERIMLKCADPVSLRQTRVNFPPPYASRMKDVPPADDGK